MLSILSKKSMKQKEGVDNHRSLLTWRFGLQVAAILIILAGAAAAPATASAAGCAGTGECYWVGGTGSWSDTTKWATATGGATTGGLPGTGDNCIWDSGSNTSNAAYTTTGDASSNCLDLNFSGKP